jgi:hypothetical protein
MRKIYLPVLLVSTLVLSSFIVDMSPYSSMYDTSRITHFYPNPATSYINFSFDNTIDKSYTLQVYNFIGRKMKEIRISEPRITLTLDDNYYRGLYIFQLRDKDGRIIESGKFQVVK